jgi:hypothetical protein
MGGTLILTNAPRLDKDFYVCSGREQVAKLALLHIHFVVCVSIVLNSDIIHFSDTGSDVDRNMGFGKSSSKSL